MYNVEAERAFMQVSDTIFEMKKHYSIMMNDLNKQRETTRKLFAKPLDLKKWNYLYNGTIINYLGVYEYACGLYNNKTIDNELFYKIYGNELIYIYEKFGPDNGKDFKNMKEAYQELNIVYKIFKEKKEKEKNESIHS